MLAGRLHYRKETLTKLVTDPASESIGESDINDAALALSLYLKHGAHGLVHLEGDFALLIWDGKQRCFVARRDPFGAYPLYWMKSGRTVAFSTAINPLIALLPGSAINLDHLADFLVLPTSRSEQNDETCAYENIQRVMPDTIVKIETNDWSCLHVTSTGNGRRSWLPL